MFITVWWPSFLKKHAGVILQTRPPNCYENTEFPPNNLAFYGFTPRDYMVVNPNIGGKNPKMDGENKGKPY